MEGHLGAALEKAGMTQQCPRVPRNRCSGNIARPLHEDDRLWLEGLRSPLCRPSLGRANGARVGPWLAQGRLLLLSPSERGV